MIRFYKDKGKKLKNMKGCEMKEQTYKKLIILLVLVCFLAFIQIIVNINLYIKATSHFVDLTANLAYSVSANLEFVLSESDETFDAAMGAARIYLDALENHFRITDYSFRYNVLWREHYFLDGLADARMATISIKENYEDIYQKNRNHEELDEVDFTYLSGLKTALDELFNSLRNEDGSLKPKAANSTYFVEHFNKFIRTVYR